MGLFGALFAGVSGLNSQSNRISMISNNIANVNTTGYKEVQAAFDTLVIPSGSTNFSPGGVISHNQQLVSKQGLITGTNSAKDIAISGNGFFAVNSNSDNTAGQLLFTRAGNFNQDSSGNFINSNGYYLQGWALDKEGKIPSDSANTSTSLSTVNIPLNSSGKAVSTSSVGLKGVLNASETLLLGAGQSLSFDKNSTNNSGIKSGDIIVGNEFGDAPQNSIVRGDSFKITDGGNNATYTFIYGGFSVGRKINDATSANLGDTATTAQTFTAATDPFVTTVGSGSITATVTGHTYAVGDKINISGVAAAVNGIPAANVNGQHIITAVTGNTITFAASGAAVATTYKPTGGSGIAFSVSYPSQSNIFTTTRTSNTVTATVPGSHYAVGDIVNFSGISGAVNGIPASDINGDRTVLSVSGTSFTFAAGNGSAATANTPTGGSGIAFNTTLSQDNPFTTTGSSGEISATVAGSHYSVGDVITIAGSGDVDGILAANINGSRTITSVSGDTFTFDAGASSTATSGVSAAGGTGITFALPYTGQIDPFSADLGSNTIAADVTGSHYNVGDTVVISGSGDVNGISASDINGTRTVVSVSGTTFTFAAGNSAVTTSQAATGGTGITAASSYTSQTNSFSTANGSNTVIASIPGSHYSVGDSVVISGSGDVNGISASNINGTRIVTSVNGSTFTFAAGNSAISTSSPSNGGTGISVSKPNPTILQSFVNQSNPFTTNITSGTENQVTVAATGNNFVVGQTIDIEGLSSTATINGIPASAINGPRTITGVTENSFTFTAGANATSAGTPTVSGISFANRKYPFTGNIMDATTTIADFLGTTTGAPFTENAKLFRMKTTDGDTVTFKYVSGTANPSDFEFNSLDSLATAINATSSLNANSQLSARIVNGRLYVGGTDANQGVTFSNGDSVGTGGLYGIDWISELGLPSDGITKADTGVKRFDTLSNLADQVNTVSAFSATANENIGSGVLSINEGDPRQTIRFADTSTNTGSLIKELGFVDNNGNSFATTQTISDTGIMTSKYDSSNVSKNMSGGGITPALRSTITVYDSLGNSHAVLFDAVKIAANDWAVEVHVNPASDLANGGREDGQIAAGLVKFDGNGNLLSIGNALANKITVNWSNSSSQSSISLNLGTIGSDDGLKQTKTTSPSVKATPNGSSAGQLDGITIDSEGYVISSFSNGQTQRTFKIPLIQVNNPDGLEAVSGDAFLTTQESGVASAVSAGTSGTGVIKSSSLENSTVDLSAQLTNLIVAQQAYGANSKLLTVADRLLQKLDQIIQ